MISSWMRWDCFSIWDRRVVSLAPLAALIAYYKLSTGADPPAVRQRQLSPCLGRPWTGRFVCVGDCYWQFLCSPAYWAEGMAVDTLRQFLHVSRRRSEEHTSELQSP